MIQLLCDGAGVAALLKGRPDHVLRKRALNNLSVCEAPIDPAMRRETRLPLPERKKSRCGAAARVSGASTQSATRRPSTTPPSGSCRRVQRPDATGALAG